MFVNVAINTYMTQGWNFLELGDSAVSLFFRRTAWVTIQYLKYCFNLFCVHCSSDLQSNPGYRGYRLIFEGLVLQKKDLFSMNLRITGIIQRKADVFALVRRIFQVELSKKYVWLDGKVKCFSFLEILKQKLYGDLLLSLQEGILVAEKGLDKIVLRVYKCLGLSE